MGIDAWGTLQYYYNANEAIFQPNMVQALIRDQLRKQPPRFDILGGRLQEVQL